MPYQAENDVTLPRTTGYRQLPTGERVELKESVNYSTGAVIFEEDLTPGVLRRLEEGDDHLSSLLRYVDASEARQILTGQVRSAASQPSVEAEILHQEERLENTPASGPQFEVGDEPAFEAPVGGDGQVSDSGTSSEENPPSVPAEEAQHVDTEAQTVGQGTEAREPEAAEEATVEGSSESTGEAVEEVTEEAQQETEAEATEDATKEPSTETQQDGQDQSTEVQDEKQAEQEPTTDKYDAMDLDALKAEVKDRKIPGRTKLKTDDALRSALRADDAEK